MFLYFVQNVSILTQITFFFSSNGHIEPDFYYFSLKTEFIWSIGPQIFSILPPIIFIFFINSRKRLVFLDLFQIFSILAPSTFFFSTNDHILPYF